MKSKKCYLALSVRAPRSVQTILEALVFDYSCSGIEEREDGFLACFPEGKSRSVLRNIIKVGEKRIKASGVPDPYEFSIEEIPRTDWSVQWRERFRPVETGEKLIIMAPWHNAVEKRIPVIIEPSMAFGTGEHPTTRLCLEAVEQCAGDAHADSLLDIGTGTGILAIAAAKLGFRRITAIDSDPAAVEIARENTGRNHTPEIEVSGGPLSTVPGLFDCIVANLTSETIKLLFDDSMKRLGRGGTCIFSGILHQQAEDMLAFFGREGIQTIDVRERDGWCAMVFQS